LPTKERIALIATLPKSGTWYSHAFFWCYEQLLSHSDAYMQGRFMPDLARALRGKSIRNKSTHRDTLGIDGLFICHTTCPGFRESGDARYGQWDALHFPLPYDWGQMYLRHHNKWEMLNPAANPGARIVYLYRNPLDHFVSYYQHALQHVDDNHRYRTLPDGTRVPVANLHDFVFDFGALGAFIKQVYSFRQMQQRFPGQVMLVPYERLTTQPAETYAAMLSFLGAPPDTPLKRRLFDDALCMCSKESLMAVESNLNRSLSASHVPEGRHIRDGRIGKWKAHFSCADLEAIESVLNAFAMTLADFNLTDGESSAAALHELVPPDPVRRQKYQTDFFQQQLGFTEMHTAALKRQMSIPRQMMRVLKSLRVAAPARAVYHLARRTVRAADKTCSSFSHVHRQKEMAELYALAIAQNAAAAVARRTSQAR